MEKSQLCSRFIARGIRKASIPFYYYVKILWFSINCSHMLRSWEREFLLHQGLDKEPHSPPSHVAVILSHIRGKRNIARRKAHGSWVLGILFGSLTLPAKTKPGQYQPATQNMPGVSLQRGQTLPPPEGKLSAGLLPLLVPLHCLPLIAVTFSSLHPRWEVCN